MPMVHPSHGMASHHTGHRIAHCAFASHGTHLTIAGHFTGMMFLAAGALDQEVPVDVRCAVDIREILQLRFQLDCEELLQRRVA